MVRSMTNPKPFRAWVAWHPKAGVYEDFSNGMFTRTLYFEREDVENVYANALQEDDGWRIMEVECSPVEGKKDD
jgi:hypothetical protein